MPKFKDVHECFASMEAIQSKDLAPWLGGKLDSIILDNQLGNKILYPDTIPETQSDLNFELALFRKLIELSKEDFYNQNTHRIDIPELLITKFGDIQKAVWIFIEGIKPLGITYFYKYSENLGSAPLGSLIRPEIISENSFITLQLNKKQYQIKGGSTIIIPAPENKINLIFSATGAKLLGKQLISLQVLGGEVGIIVDARNK